MTLQSPPSPQRFSPPAAAPPMALTPRSKVKAMLAALDDDEDSAKENHGAYPLLQRENAHDTSLHPSRGNHFQDAHTGVTKTNPIPSSPELRDRSRSDPDSSDDELIAAQPRKGTMAARMQMQTRDYDSKDQDEQHDEEGPYERVKRRILAKNDYEKRLPVAIKQNIRDEDDDGSMADSEREETPSVAAKRKIRTRDESMPREALGHRETRSVSRSPSGGLPSPSDASLSLFVSPEKPGRVEDDQSSNLDPSSAKPSEAGSRFQALLARKRQEMNEKTDRKATQKPMESSDDEDSTSRPQGSEEALVQALSGESETDEDRELGKKLTQQARPTRKASKKALEELNRETQRMSRNMQLTHEARTKTKFAKEDFLAKFKFGQSANLAPAQSATSSSSAPGTPGVEPVAAPDTPPSSPPSFGGTPDKTANRPAVQMELENGVTAVHEELPDVDTLLTQVPKEPPMNQAPQTGNIGEVEKPAVDRTKRYSARRFAKSTKPVHPVSDSDDDLEIVKTAPASRLAIFDNLPASKARESHSLHALRALAHLHDTEKLRNRGQKSMTQSELQTLLHRRAREQAKHERDEKIQRLREKGVLVQTAEEKEQEQMQLENMLERARKEAEEIALREKEAAKREGKQGGDDFPDSEDEDGDYEGSADDEEVLLSGSEDEAGGVVGDEEDSGDVESAGSEDDEPLDADDAERIEEATNSLLDNEANEDSEEEEKSEDADEMDDKAEQSLEIRSDVGRNTHRQPRRRKKVILSDDEDDDEAGGADDNKQQTQPIPEVFTPKQSPSDAFGFARTNPAPLGLSQVFAGTMAESQTQAQDITGFDSQQDSLAFLRGIPPPDLPDFTTPLAHDSPSVRIRDSQINQTPTRVHSQHSGPVYFDTQTTTLYGGETIGSEMPDPTQDVGFQVVDSQAPMNAPSFSTVDTVPLADSTNALPHPYKRKGRLVRRADANEYLGAGSDIEHDQSLVAVDVDELSANAFDVMRNAVKRPVALDDFDRKKSEAKGMVEEQAEESEDEYAGLGGASDDESAGYIDEETKQMIDDDDNATTNARDIAAYYAEKERLEDEKGIEKLYKDVINGGLRRKRGAQDDLWESDDEDEIAARRRAAKQREFAKMRKALLADEKLGKIAENPKQQAFLQAIEDRDDSYDIDFLDQPDDEISQVTDSQSGASRRPERLSVITGNANKRKHAELDDGAAASQEENRPPPNLRRTTKTTRPTSLADIRNTLSEIIGEPESILESQRLVSESPSHSSYDSEAEIESEQEEAALDCDHEDLYASPTEMLPPPLPFSVSHRPLASHSAAPNRRRTAPDAARTTVIDRMALKRAASSSSNSAAAASGDRLAFHAASKSAYGGFRVPSLLRRATTNGSTASTSTSTSTAASASGSEANGGLGGKETVRMGGTKKSSVNYYVRETERRAKIEQVERERQQGRQRIGKMRRRADAGGIGVLVGGSFE